MCLFLCRLNYSPFSPGKPSSLASTKTIFSLLFISCRQTTSLHTGAASWRWVLCVSSALLFVDHCCLMCMLGVSRPWIMTLDSGFLPLKWASTGPDLTTCFGFFLTSETDCWYDRHVAAPRSRLWCEEDFLITWFDLLRTASWADVQYLLPPSV